MLTHTAPDRPLMVLAGHRKDGRCRDCRQRVVWVTTAPKGRMVPFDRAPLVLGTHTNPRTGVRFEQVSRDGIHFASCRAALARRSGATR